MKNMDTEKKVMRLSFTLVISVFAIKLTVSFLTNSFSFYTELADAAMDLIVVLITRFALIRSKKPADEEHMFGHSKINTLAGLVESLLIVGVYISIIYTAFNTLIEENRYETE